MSIVFCVRIFNVLLTMTNVYAECFLSNFNMKVQFYLHIIFFGVLWHLHHAHEEEPYNLSSVVRLVDGSINASGRVEIYHNGTWGTVCDDFWGYNEARVICRQLGFAGVQFYTMHYGLGSGPIMRALECNGNEIQWKDCHSYDWNTTKCNHHEDSGVICRSEEPTSPPDTVRLTTTSKANRGRVEIYYNGVWGTICDHHWDYEEANVVCRQLGFAGAENSFFGALVEAGSGPILGHLACNGTEERWTDCSIDDWDTYSCLHIEDAGATCTYGDSTVSAKDGDIRLVGSSSENEGLVEIYHSRTWGTVCDGDWDIDEATVVCNQLGFPGVLMAEGDTYFGPSDNTVTLHDVSCTGEEHYLIDCKHGEWSSHTCEHHNVAGVRCYIPSIHYPRLMNGSQQYEGRVEIWNGIQWTKLCSNGGFWETEANVICKELGFDEAAHIFTDEKFGHGSAPPSDFNYDCLENDKSLSQCYHTSHFGYSCTASGVICSKTKSSSSGAIAGFIIGAVIILGICFATIGTIFKRSKEKKTARVPADTLAILKSENTTEYSSSVVRKTKLVPTDASGEAPPTYNDVLNNTENCPSVIFNAESGAIQEKCPNGDDPPYFTQSNLAFSNI
ncbi:Deleted in malignant brain tumors 1 protein [Holothuria leucospilota]|uniref:Deleted in malignant brain tumors 1 protein n=1 Tax=Holothuria leucospilota TaxID=206669 RepID=A0A9Q0YU92_HOLLE|nr:Deleted in malignant brain tumors 1 protein [Holothuria leucospilota]